MLLDSLLLPFVQSLIMTRRQIWSFYIFCAFSRTRSTTKYKDFDLACKGSERKTSKTTAKISIQRHTYTINLQGLNKGLSEVCVCAWFHTDLHYTLARAWVSLVKPKYKLSLCKAHKGTLTEQTNTLKRTFCVHCCCTTTELPAAAHIDGLLHICFCWTNKSKITHWF